MTFYESREQESVINWARLQSSKYEELKYLHSSLNGFKLSKSQACRAKKEGMLAGIPDLFLPLPAKNYHGLYIEMKRQQSSGKSKISPAQKNVINYLKNVGYCVKICYGAEEAIQTIKNYLSEVYNE